MCYFKEVVKVSMFLNNEQFKCLNQGTLSSICNGGIDIQRAGEISGMGAACFEFPLCRSVWILHGSDEATQFPRGVGFLSLCVCGGLEMCAAISFFSRFEILEGGTLWFGMAGHRTAFFHVPLAVRKFKVDRRSSLNI